MHPGKSPAVNRQAMEAADQSIKALQQLDNTGYSGHLSYILYMLSIPAFMAVYETGGFKPSRGHGVWEIP